MYQALLIAPAVVASVFVIFWLTTWLERLIDPYGPEPALGLADALDTRRTNHQVPGMPR